MSGTDNPGGVSDGVPIRLVLVDDHQMFADSLARVLRDEPDIEIVGVVGSSAGAIQLVRETGPDVAIVDYRLPDGDGVETAMRIRAASPDTKVLMLTALSDNQVVRAAIDAGCSGFLTKDRAARELVRAVRLVHSGEAYLSPDVLTGLLPGLGQKSAGSGSELTDREREILQLLAEGLANRAIAARLSLSLHTVRNHVQRILVKLAAHSKLEAVAVAVREGLVERPR